MKTITILSAKKHEGSAPAKILPPIITIGFFLLVLLSLSARAQNDSTSKPIFPSSGIKTTALLTGSGLSASYNIQVYHKRNNWLVCAGPLFQFKNNKFCGVQTGYEYTVCGKEKNESQQSSWTEADYPSNIELFFFANGIFRNSSTLNRASTNLERQYFNESGISFPAIRLQSIEVYSGFGLRIKCTNNLKITGSIGAGGYSFLKNNYELYHDKSGVGLLLATGISWNFSPVINRTKHSIIK